MQDLKPSTLAPVPSAPPFSIGTLRHLRILCISEVGWLDTPTLLADIAAAGGMSANQYQVPWPPFAQLHADNADIVAGVRGNRNRSGKHGPRGRGRYGNGRRNGVRQRIQDRDCD